MKAVSLAGGAYHLGLQRLGAQAQHAHEQQHVQRGTKLEGMQRPEIGTHIAFDHFDQDGSGYKVNRPSGQKVIAHTVAPASAFDGTWQAQECWRKPQRADDRSHLVHINQIHRKTQRKDDGKPGTSLHQPAKPRFGIRSGQRLFDKKERARRSDQCRQATHVQLSPGVVGPHILPAYSKLQQRKQQAARD